jgi:Fe-S-cluster-containing dehydrogenase component
MADGQVETDRPTTCAAVMLQGPEDTPPAALPGPLLRIDLDVCFMASCATCTAVCSYPAHPHNNGVLALRELAGYAVVCRRCEHPHCVDACPRQALEQRPELGNMLVRHHLRCVGCRSCSHACPYGTILPELVPYLTHNCDFCAGRSSRDNPPQCVVTCPHQALSVWPGGDELPEQTYRIGRLLVHSSHWRRELA